MTLKDIRNLSIEQQVEILSYIIHTNNVVVTSPFGGEGEVVSISKYDETEHSLGMYPADENTIIIKTDLIQDSL